MDPRTSLVVGKKGCTYKDVVDVFFNEVNSGTVLNTWRELARELSINSGQIDKWRKDAELLDKLTEKDVLHKILETWKSEKGKDATLANLLKHLEKVKLNNVADDLRKLFLTINRIPKDGALLKATLPKRPKYYIPRTLITRNVIDTKVFSSTHKDVFVVHGGGIERYRLSQLANKGLTDTSTSQVRKDKLSVRFILLEHFGDWDLLCGKTTNSIHLLRYREGRFHWVCTKGDISGLQKASDEKTQNELSEEEFIQEIENGLQFQTNQPICISDSPGMGKSLLLASIGRQLQQTYPERVIAFIVISEFAVKIRELLAKFDDKAKAVLEALFQTLCENTFAREHLFQKMTTPTEDSSTQIELMFDGFDEVSSENFTLAHECLENLRANFNSTTRLWVTTRPQHLDELEKRFSVLGSNIQAFQEKHQIDFLTSFWSNQQKNLDGSKLRKFSKNCLSTLKEKLNKKDEDIAGIPLQCMMIAEVYSEEAHRFCDSKNKRLENWTESSSCIDINSIADLYKQLILHKIKKFIATFPLVPEKVTCILPWHMYLALELIFPSHAHKFKDTLNIESGVEFDHLLNVGILEKRGTTTKEPARFIHRIFAEYLVARFVVVYLIAPSRAELQNSSRNLPNFLFEEVLECSVENCDDDATITYYQCSFEHSVLCHFLDALLGAKKLISTENCISQKPTEYMRNIVYACIHADFGNIITFLHSLRYSDSFGISYMHLDFKILIDAATIASLDLIIFLLHGFEHKPLTEGSPSEAVSYLRPTPLHAAVRRGSYTIFEYILNGHDFEDLVKEDKRFQDLVYWAVANTVNALTVELRDRVQIVTALCDLNREMINYCKEDKQTPLFANRVNIILLKKLIECGADLLHLDRDNNTILHKAAEYLSPIDYYELLKFIPNPTLTSLLKKHNNHGETGLHPIVGRGLATPDILNLIVVNGIDINTSGKVGKTCIVYALEMENEDMTIPTINLLLENGADLACVDINGESIVHYSAMYGLINCLRFFLEEKNMDVNQINAFGHTPIFSALESPLPALEVVQFVLERGADYKISNSRRENLLHYSAYFSQLECLQLFLSLGGLNINQANEDGETPLFCALNQNDEKAMEVIRLLLSKGADHTISNKKGNNILHILAEFGNAELFSHFAGLPSLGVNARNCNKDTPLHLVIKNSLHYFCLSDDLRSFLHNIEKLLSLGADVNLKNDNDETPLDIYLGSFWYLEGEEELMKKVLTIGRLLEGNRQKIHSAKENAH